MLKTFFLKLFGVIPRGYYCHFSDGRVCRYWSMKHDLPEQENGYCSLIGKSDWDINEECGTVEVTHYDGKEVHKSRESTHNCHISLLFDKVKEC